MGKLLNSLAYWVTLFSLFVYVYIRFSSRGVGGSEELFGYGRILAVSDLVMLSYLGLNLPQFRRLSPMAFLICLWLIWVVITCAGLWGDGVDRVIFGLMEVSYCPLLFLFFYVVIRQKPDRHNTANAAFLLLLVFSAVLFLLVFRYQNMYLVRGAAVLNDVYYLLLLLPWVLLCPKALWKYAGIVLIAIIVLWSMKRTALLALTVALVVYFLSEKIRNRTLLDWRWLIVSCLFALISLQVYFYVDDQNEGFLSSRILSAADDGGSGRLDIYQEVFRLQRKSSIDEWLLGHGHDTVRKFNTLQESEYLSAHNDWLEVMFDYGLPALALYCCLHFFLLSYTCRLLVKRSYYGPPMAASYILFFMLSLTSHLVLYASYFGYLMSFWGCICAINELETTMHRARYFPYKGAVL